MNRVDRCRRVAQFMRIGRRTVGGRNKGGKSACAQPTIDVGRQPFLQPFLGFTAERSAIRPRPQCKDSDQPRLLLRYQHHAAPKSIGSVKRVAHGQRNLRLDPCGPRGQRHEFNTVGDDFGHGIFCGCFHFSGRHGSPRDSRRLRCTRIRLDFRRRFHTNTGLVTVHLDWTGHESSIDPPFLAKRRGRVLVRVRRTRPGEPESVTVLRQGNLCAKGSS